MATKNVLITGGSRGLGKHLIHIFAHRGHRVVTTYRNTPPSLHHPNVQWIRCDLTDTHSVQHMMDTTSRDFDRQFDIVINNAAQSNGYTLFSEFDNVQDVISTNLTAPAYIINTLFAYSRHQTHPCHIFNVIGAGSNGHKTPFYSLYGATKCALHHLTMSLRSEVQNDTLLKNKIRLHIVSPGMMPTPLLLQNLPKDKVKILALFQEDPEVVADVLFTKIAYVTEKDLRNAYINYPICQTLLRKLSQTGFAQMQ